MGVQSISWQGQATLRWNLVSCRLQTVGSQISLVPQAVACAGSQDRICLAPDLRRLICP